MERRAHTSPQDEITRIIVEFLEVAINSIVFLKEIYPPGAFERRRYMNIVVQRARHPQLRDYIQSSVIGLQPFIQKGLVERVAVIFFNNENIPMERFVFKFTVKQMYGFDMEETSLELSLRSFLVKLFVCKSLTKVFSKDCKWEIAAYFRTLPQANAGKEAQLWIPTATNQWHQTPVITPIKSVSSEPLCLQLYLEHPDSFKPKGQQ